MESSAGIFDVVMKLTIVVLVAAVVYMVIGIRGENRFDGDVLQNTDDCTYAGLTYSEGSRVDQAGTVMECSGGSWVVGT